MKDENKGKLNYYGKELNILKDSVYGYQVVFIDSESNKTKHLNVNEESIPTIIDFLSTELRRLEGESK